MAPKKILQYEEEVLLKALDDVARGMPIYAAAKKYGIPRSTIRSKVKGINPISRKMGAHTTFTSTEELLLENWVVQLAKRGFPVSKPTFLFSVQRLAAQLGKDAFKEKLPSKKWYKGFMDRHPRISNRVAQNLTKSRSSVTQEQLDAWKREVEDYLTAHGYLDILNDPTRVFNADETAFFLQPKAGKVLAERGSNNIYQSVGNDEKECITVLFNGNAAGQLAPPMVVFRYARIPLHISEKIPSSWAIGRSEQGWMNCAIFYEYMANQFNQWLDEHGISRPIIFFVDGHVSHLSFEVSKFCSENGIILIALFPNATHILQPMDVAVFHTLKSSWKEKTMQHRLNGGEVTKANFCGLLAELLQESYRPEILRNGFKKCGLQPWNPLAVTVNGGLNKRVNESERPQQNKLCCPGFISMLKFLIGQEKLQIFSEGDESILPIVDHSLYQLWKKVSALEAGYTSTTIIPSVANETSGEQADKVPSIAPLSPNEDLTTESEMILAGPSEPGNSPPEVTELVRPASPKPDEVPSTSTADVTVPVASTSSFVVSPFKKSLFWPKEKVKESQGEKKRKFKEKVPSVVSSAEWQLYHEKKSSEKKKKEEEKQKRLAMRLQKKKEQEEEKLKRAANRQLALNSKKRKKAGKQEEEDSEESDLDFVHSSRSSSGGEWEENTSSDGDSEMRAPEKKIGEYVAISYDGKFFPGRIVELKDGGAVVTAMVRNGHLWKWPAREDTLFYSWDEIPYKIGTPVKFSKTRDIFNVPDIQKL